MDATALPALMLEIVQARAVAPALRSIVDGLAACPRVALARVWLTGPGDRCATCSLAAECGDRSLCLHLVSGAGQALDAAADPTRTDGTHERVPIGARAVGRVARAGQPLVVTDLAERGRGIADADWLEREQVRTFVAEPLRHRGETLGVLALFDRDDLDDRQLGWLGAFAAHAAVSLANARAFERVEAARRRLEEENGRLQAAASAPAAMPPAPPAPPELVGRSPAFRKLQRQVELAAASDLPVLLEGEVGSGRRTVARAIHARGARGRLPFVTLAAGEPGSPEALAARLSAAAGGTLLVEEVSDLSPEAQAGLLRFLQEGLIAPSGEATPLRADVRVIAATARDLSAEAAAGRFREDLYCRLSVIGVRVPPLRARPDDVPLLAAHFTGLAARGLGRRPPRLASVELERLRACDWPGNVRELQLVVERAVLLAGEGPVAFGPLAPARRRRRTRPVVAAEEGPPPMTREELRDLERRNIETALARAGGRVFGPEGAAQLLGMRPTTLASRLRALGIEKPRRKARP